MQPWPPWALKPSAVMSSPESWLKSSPIAVALLRDARHVGGGVLHAGDVLQLIEPLHGVDVDVDDRAGRNVVHDDRNADRVVDRLEVLVEPFLGRLVVVRRDHQHGVGAGLLGMLATSSTASAVEFEPAPAITGTRPLAWSTHHSTTCSCSLWVSVGLSPVVPTGTRPLVPSAICQSTSSRNAFSSTEPFLNGVTSAVNDPRNLVLAVMACSSAL